MKRIGIFLAIAFLLLAPTILGLEVGGIEGAIDKKAGEIEGRIEGIQELTKEDIKWEYLSQEIQKIMLKNKVIAFLDLIFQKLDFIFVALFGQHYEISLTLLVSIIIFFYVFMSFREIFKDYAVFSEGISDAIAFLMCVITAQFGIYQATSELMFKLIFYNEGWFAWVRAIIIILILIGLNYALRYGGEIQKKRREDLKKLKTELAHKKIQATGKIAEMYQRAFSGRRVK